MSRRVVYIFPNAKSLGKRARYRRTETQRRHAQRSDRKKSFVPLLYLSFDETSTRGKRIETRRSHNFRVYLFASNILDCSFVAYCFYQFLTISKRRQLARRHISSGWILTSVRIFVPREISNRFVVFFQFIIPSFRAPRNKGKSKREREHLAYISFSTFNKHAMYVTPHTPLRFNCFSLLYPLAQG